MQALLIMLSTYPHEPSCFEIKIEHDGIGIVCGVFPWIVDEDIEAIIYALHNNGDFKVSFRSPIFLLKYSSLQTMGILFVGCLHINMEEFGELHSYWHLVNVPYIENHFPCMFLEMNFRWAKMLHNVSPS